MKGLAVVLCAVLLLAGCTRDWNPLRHTIIDWVDFVKVDGNTYEHLYGTVLADANAISEQVVSEVRFKLDENVTNPNYKSKDGDAAFLEEGTKLYAIKGLTTDHYLAAADTDAINGYKIYFSPNNGERKTWHFKDLIQADVMKIEVYEGYAGNNLIHSYKGVDVQEILSLLNSSEEKEDYQSRTLEGDASAYRVVIYDHSPVAQMHYIYKDDHSYFWHPWGTNVLDEKVGEYLTL
jgi:hypothetical protein